MKQPRWFCDKTSRKKTIVSHNNSEISFLTHADNSNIYFMEMDIFFKETVKNLHRITSNGTQKILKQFCIFFDFFFLVE